MLQRQHKACCHSPRVRWQLQNSLKGRFFGSNYWMRGLLGCWDTYGYIWIHMGYWDYLLHNFIIGRHHNHTTYKLLTSRTLGHHLRGVAVSRLSELPVCLYFCKTGYITCGYLWILWFLLIFLIDIANFWAKLIISQHKPIAQRLLLVRGPDLSHALIVAL